MEIIARHAKVVIIFQQINNNAFKLLVAVYTVMDCAQTAQMAMLLTLVYATLWIRIVSTRLKTENALSVEIPSI
jgi:ABC-type maltose transport system permease subunit